MKDLAPKKSWACLRRDLGPPTNKEIEYVECCDILPADYVFRSLYYAIVALDSSIPLHHSSTIDVTYFSYTEK